MNYTVEISIQHGLTGRLLRDLVELTELRLRFVEPAQAQVIVQERVVKIRKRTQGVSTANRAGQIVDTQTDTPRNSGWVHLRLPGQEAQVLHHLDDLCLPPPGGVVAVQGWTGGCGTTTLCLGLAGVLGQLALEGSADKAASPPYPRQVTVVENSGFAGLAPICGIDGKPGCFTQDLKEDSLLHLIEGRIPRGRVSVIAQDPNRDVKPAGANPLRNLCRLSALTIVDGAPEFEVDVSPAPRVVGVAAIRPDLAGVSALVARRHRLPPVVVLSGPGPVTPAQLRGVFADSNPIPKLIQVPWINGFARKTLGKLNPDFTLSGSRRWSWAIAKIAGEVARELRTRS